MLSALGCSAGQDQVDNPDTTEPSQIVHGSAKVMINGLPAAVGKDPQATIGAILMNADGPDGPALETSTDVIINGYAARKLVEGGNECQTPASVIISDNVLIGE